MKPSATPLLVSGVTMTADEFVAANFRLWQKRPRTKLNHWLLGVALLLLGVSVALDVMQTGYVSNWSTVAVLAVGVLYGLFRMQLVRYQLRRGYAKNTVLQVPVAFTFDAEMLRGQSTDGRFEVRWRTLRRAVWVQPNWLLLYPTEAACYYVDLRRVQVPGTPEQLLSLVRAAGVPVVEI
ncbi:hypothetical protein J0X19_18960 [Hymenobacter sp. BT186]|uniref:YcxB family protein n=1 Tax=Hymenobacter telluris TaxID=2816474 RepID=A0A939EYZ6_9BACT|nr:hypothetical protein [Hymenobacter telluris]MBO0360048.1 hypothetical protein [Hymenobacter telluris]MBW3376075.1 hypothetical protein [Hymenobacter norwichensis]